MSLPRSSRRRSVLPLALVGLVILSAAVGALLLRGRPEADRPGPEAMLRVSGEVLRGGRRVVSEITRISDAEEIELGGRIAAQIARQMPVLDETGAPAAAAPSPARFVQEVGVTVAGAASRKAIPYHFSVLDMSDVNAFAIPGGRIYVTTGMLKFVRSEAELAAVLGHEIAHVDLRHCVEQVQTELAARKVGGEDLAAVTAIASTIFALSFSEEQELEADEYGTIFAAGARYDPTAVVGLMERVRAAVERPQRPLESNPLGEAARILTEALEGYASTHPPFRTRIGTIRTVVQRQGYDRPGRLFYVGEQNLRDLTPRSEREIPDEWRILNPASG